MASQKRIAGLLRGPGPDRSADNYMLARLLIFLVILYRGTLGMFLGGHCRFTPSCSAYMIDAIRQYGAVRGLWRGIKRIGRCHPWGGGGYDPA